MTDEGSQAMPRSSTEDRVVRRVEFGHVNDDRMVEADRRNMERVRAVEAELSAQGLTTHMTDARVGLDLTVTLAPGRLREPEFWIDEDGYAELRYWNRPDATPAQIAATALRALEIVSNTLDEPSRGMS
jgi:hypothetical protein